MRRTTTETQTFTRTEYLCDLCGEQLLTGKKPSLCFVCSRETCGTITCRDYRDFPDDYKEQVVCSSCLGHWHYYSELEAIAQEADARAMSVLSAWKARSLADVLPAERLPGDIDV